MLSVSPLLTLAADARAFIEWCRSSECGGSVDCGGASGGQGRAPDRYILPCSWLRGLAAVFVNLLSRAVWSESVSQADLPCVMRSCDRGKQPKERMGSASASAMQVLPITADLVDDLGRAAASLYGLFNIATSVAVMPARSAPVVQRQEPTFPPTGVVPAGREPPPLPSPPAATASEAHATLSNRDVVRCVDCCSCVHPFGRK